MGMTNWHRRHALLLVAQLPDNAEDSQLILQYAKELLDHMKDDIPPIEAADPK